MLDRFFRGLLRQAIRVGLGHVTFAYVTGLGEGRTTQVFVWLLGPSAVFISLAFGVAVNEAECSGTCQAKDAVAKRASSACVVYRVFATRLYAGSCTLDLDRRFFFRFSVARDAAMLVSNDERFIVVVYEDRLRNRRILFDQDAAGRRYGIVEEANDYTRHLRLLRGREGRHAQVRSDFYFLVWVDFVNESASFNRAGRSMLRTFYYLSVSLNERIAFYVRLVMRVREDVLEMARILFNVYFMGAR